MVVGTQNPLKCFFLLALFLYNRSVPQQLLYSLHTHTNILRHFILLLRSTLLTPQRASFFLLISVAHHAIAPDPPPPSSSSYGRPYVEVIQGGSCESSAAAPCPPSDCCPPPGCGGRYGVAVAPAVAAAPLRPGPPWPWEPQCQFMGRSHECCCVLDVATSVPGWLGSNQLKPPPVEPFRRRPLRVAPPLRSSIGS